MSAELEIEIVDEQYDFDWSLWPQQSIAYLTPANEVLFGGAKGPGKSFLMRCAFCMWCIEAPGLQCYLFRRIWQDLKQNHLEGPTSFHVLLSRMVEKGHCKITSHEIKFWNGARIYLNHLQLEKHVTKYQGPEMHVAGFDELTQFTEMQYRYLRGSLRLGSWKPPAHFPKGFFPRILCGANPGGVSHAFVKETFIDNGAYNIVKMSADEGGMLRQFIPARNTDNPALLQNDPDYLDRLEGMGDKVLVRAMKDGDWEVVAGSMFGETWRKMKDGKPWHVCPPFRIPEHWDLWRGGDDGFSAPLAYYWFAKDPSKKTIFVIDELYGTQILPTKAASLTLERDYLVPMVTQDGEDIILGEALEGMLDSEAFSEPGDGSISRGDQMNNKGCHWKPVEKWHGSRIARVQNFHRLLHPQQSSVSAEYPEGRPGIVFFDTCANAIKFIPQLPRSDKRIEDIADDFPHDHSFDGVTYGLQYRLGGFKKIDISGI
jgi:hypothetical protein